ncbi:hypothetical protein EXIGLDRAFT_783167 [Exidia glandulosa HHB12029]|uniref:CxC2-like cysteine cluster KDZ transposase-associated domain-containing protein n=1 Tax=Exidia glandulosa HHB12029 TaxID=1314781 RepID=A0A166N7P3_EXIGL|nr:hypothetical protein EXIGLDRAFT_783167 [Exidia glandulosa HHB12029]
MRDSTKVRTDKQVLGGRAEQPEENKKRKWRHKVAIQSDKVTLSSSAVDEGQSRVEPTAPPTPSRSKRPKGKGTGHGQFCSKLTSITSSTSSTIAYWRRTLFSLEYDPVVGTPCPCEHGQPHGEGGPRVWRCVDCSDQRACCSLCLRARHQCLPFHKVQQWNGKFFARSSLNDAGVRLFLGHEGVPCPNLNQDSAIVIKIGDVSGIHSMTVHKCECRGYGEDPEALYAQLLRARLFPATFERPQTAFTFALMEHWHLDVLQGKKPVYDYWISLQRRTHVVAKDLTGYREFLRAGRFWRDLTSRKQSGQGQGIDDFLPANRYPGSVAVVCPACPEPGFNLPDDWYEKLDDPKSGFTLIKVLGIDGAYKTYLKVKRHDPLDRPTNSGGAYFSPFDDTLEYELLFELIPEEPGGPCPGVDGMHRAAGGRNTQFSGVVAVVCVRHSIFCARSFVNLRKNEKFSIMDLALKNSFGPKPDPRLRVVISSDRACQYWIKILERWARQFPDAAAHHKIIEDAVWRVPKAHVVGHTEECQYGLHFGYLPGGGRTDGEGVERPWPETNATGMITKDANAGHREDILNDTQRDWCWKKTVGMADFLKSKAKDAALNLKRTKMELEEYEASLEKTDIERWNAEFPSEDAWRDENGQLQSRYRADATKVPKRGHLLQMIAEEEQKRGGMWAKGKGPMALLRRLIDLEERQEKLKKKANNLADNDRVGQAALSKARIALRVEIKLVRPLQKHHMPALADTLQAQDELMEDIEAEDTPEDEDLHLPSSFTPAEREDYGLTKLAEVELRLRRCYAESELELLKLSIRLYFVDVSGKRKHVEGIERHTRANSKISKDARKRDKHMERYNLHYKSMLSLGHDAKDKMFQTISSDIVKKVKDMTKSQELGTGTKPDAWFWREGKDVAAIAKTTDEDLAKLNDEERRVRYFRMWAIWKRWDEEWLILGAELDRTVRSFGKMAEVWTSVAKREGEHVATRRTRHEEKVAEYSGKGTPLKTMYAVDASLGKCAYAWKKVELYSRLQEGAITAWQEAGLFDEDEPGRGWDGWSAPPERAAGAPKPKRARIVL